jgi:azurin
MFRVTTAALLLLASAAYAQAPARTIEITVGDNMKFSVTEIAAKPGEPLHVVVKSNGQMPKMAMAHNFVLLQKGTDPAKFLQPGVGSRDTDFIAPSERDKVIAATKMVGPGETADVTFNAPAKPGTYQYICTFTGHYTLGMKGTLTVK